MQRNIEIMDTTLRDGEQTVDVAFSPTEKLTIAKLLLDEVNVNRIEVASARVSTGELEAVQRITNWAKNNNHLHKIEILGFLDGNKSINWVKQAGGNTINLLCKGSLDHLTQLNHSEEEHIEKIETSVLEAVKNNMTVNIYLEDWSRGAVQNAAYCQLLYAKLSTLPIKRIMLPDTLGVLIPSTTQLLIQAAKKHLPTMQIDFHAHNDYDCAVGNCLAAIESGVDGIHTTVNGLGERAGNAALASVIACIHDHVPSVTTQVKEPALNRISNIVSAFSGLNIATNTPIIGEHVFTQTCGVHADGDTKNNLYCNALAPERFGRSREYALGKTAGKASVQKNLEALGITLEPEEIQLVTQRIKELGDNKQEITKADLPFVIADVLGTNNFARVVTIQNYFCSHVYKLKPVATLSIKINTEIYEATATGDGQYDAFMNALRSIYTPLKKELPQLINYKVSIPPGGQTDALVKTSITWLLQKKEFKTMGLESDQQAAAIAATLKMLNIIENDQILL